MYVPALCEGQLPSYALLAITVERIIHLASGLELWRGPGPSDLLLHLGDLAVDVLRADVLRKHGLEVVFRDYEFDTRNFKPSVRYMGGKKQTTLRLPYPCLDDWRQNENYLSILTLGVRIRPCRRSAVSPPFSQSVRTPG